MNAQLGDFFMPFYTQSLSLDDNQDRGPPVPLVVHHKLIGFTDIELQVIVIAPCDEALYQSFVLHFTKWYT